MCLALHCITLTFQTFKLRLPVQFQLLAGRRSSKNRTAATAEAVGR